MAKSAAKKRLKHLLRQNVGGFDPRLQRGGWGGVKPISRIKPNRRKEEVFSDGW